MRARGLTLILIIAAILRFSLVFVAAYLNGEMHIFLPDSNTYLIPAQNILAHAEFANSVGSEIVRTPGYPLLLAFAEWCGGVEKIIIPLQIALSMMTILSIFFIAQHIFKKTSVALMSAALYAIEPQAIYFSQVILSETLFTALLLFGTLFFFKWQSEKKNIQLLVSTLSLCAAIYVRPIALLIPLLLFVFTALRHKTQRRVLLFALLLYCLSVGLWTIRNINTGGYSGFSAITDINLYAYQAAAVVAHNENRPYHEVQAEFSNARSASTNPAERYKWMRSQALQIIGDNPTLYAKIHLKGIIRMLFDPGATDYLKFFGFYPARGGLLSYALDHGMVSTIQYLQQNKPLVFWSNVLFGMLLGLYYFLAFGGITHGFRREKCGTIILIGLLLYFLLLSGGPISLHRFRHPMMPMLCIFAGYTMNNVLGYFRSFLSRNTRDLNG